MESQQPHIVIKRLELLDEMRESMIANVAYHSSDPHVGMRLILLDILFLNNH